MQFEMWTGVPLPEEVAEMTLGREHY
jgi:hypothetical protein